MERERHVRKALDEGEGIVRLAPAWVPRAFLSPGARLAADDVFALGAQRGGLSERWLASTTRADNEGVPEE